ncbi:hypothetical protein MTYP_01666 [Methylophilaceae bacterium]|nr:hypothetical protein MTYP_01666 [Methylophilaceae bacterium]
MTPLQPQKKRSAGRPKENKLLRELKVKTWFNAVAEASGKTAYQLEKEFAPSYVDRDKFHKQRSRLWEKYRTGKIVPTMKETKGGRRPIALMVEEKYPGTLRWLAHPLWRILDLDAEITMMDLRVVYESLPAELSDLILEKERTGLFWRKSIDSSIPHITMLCDQKSIEAATVLVCLWRESLISQQKYLYDAILVAIKLWRKANQSSHIQSITTILIKFNSKLKI